MRQYIVKSFVTILFFMRRSRQVLELCELLLVVVCVWGGQFVWVQHRFLSTIQCFLLRLHKFSSRWDPHQPSFLQLDFGSMNFLRGGIQHIWWDIFATISWTPKVFEQSLFFLPFDWLTVRLTFMQKGV